MHHSAATIISIGILTFAMPAAAEVFYDQARVIDTQPIYETRQVPTQVQECGYEQPATSNPVDPASLGDARATDPGAGLLGALDRDMEMRKATAEVYRCRMVMRTADKKELAGYEVRYEYAGRIYERRMTAHPGNSINVSVALSANQPGTGRRR